jgi:PST family polysaccharide transporter
MMLAIFLPVALGGTLIAPAITRFFFGTAYAATARPLAILLWYILLSALSISFSNALLAANEDRPYIAAVTIGALMDMALIAFMVPRWGVSGAAAAMVVAEFFILTYLALAAKRRLGLSFVPLRAVLPILLSTGVMAAFIWLLRSRLAVLGVIACAIPIYAGALAVLFFLVAPGPKEEVLAGGHNP